MIFLHSASLPKTSEIRFPLENLMGGSIDLNLVGDNNGFSVIKE